MKSEKTENLRETKRLRVKRMRRRGNVKRNADLIVGDGYLFIRNVFFLLVDSRTAGHVDLCFVVHSVVWFNVCQVSLGGYCRRWRQFCDRCIVLCIVKLTVFSDIVATDFLVFACSLVSVLHSFAWFVSELIIRRSRIFHRLQAVTYGTFSVLPPTITHWNLVQNKRRKNKWDKEHIRVFIWQRK